MSTQHNNATEGAVATIALSMILVPIFEILSAIAIGLFFGAAWGFAAIAFFVALTALYLFVIAAITLKKNKKKNTDINSDN